VTGEELSPFRNPAWDKFVLGGVENPGVARVVAKREIGWDVKDATGQDGASTTRKGQPIGEIEVEYYLVDDPNEGNDFDAWPAYEAVIWSTVDGDKPKPVDCQHPDATRLRFTSVALKTPGSFQPDGKGGAKVKFVFLEYKPPKPKPAKGASGSKSKSGKTDGDKAIDKATDAINKLNDEANSL
jgi:hypothetical protein